MTKTYNSIFNHPHVQAPKFITCNSEKVFSNLFPPKSLNSSELLFHSSLDRFNSKFIQLELSQARIFRIEPATFPRTCPAEQLRNRTSTQSTHPHKLHDPYTHIDHGNERDMSSVATVPIKMHRARPPGCNPL